MAPPMNQITLFLLTAGSLVLTPATAAEGLDDLFDLDAPLDGAVEAVPAAVSPPEDATEVPDPALDDAFRLDVAEGEPASGHKGGPRLSGYGEISAAHTTPDPEHWSKLRARLELAATGNLGSGVKYKVTGRADLDGAFDLEDDFYPGAVRRDQRREFMWRETYLDFGSGDLEFRLGRQHVVWGEVVGLFVADVVSARDMREFLLPEFESMRIPQWAARAEYFAGETHFEALWIPYPSHDDIGKPGADFYPFPIPGNTPIHTVERDTELSNTNWGLRVSHLVAGWDLSAFYYQSLDASPTLYRLPTGLELRNDRINQVGGTFSKDYDTFVLKGEAVHTRGRRFLTSEPSAPFGLDASNTLDYVIGADLPHDDWRFNAQYYGRYTFGHSDGMTVDQDEHGLTFLVNRKFGGSLEAELLYVTSLNRTDYMLRPKLVWNMTQEWRAQFGVDVFGGPDDGLFGRFDDSDRVYVEVRRWF